MGDFFVVNIMSGGHSASVALAMYNQIAAVQYPPAAASAVILLVIVVLMVAAILRLVDVRRELAGMRHMQRDLGKRPRSFYFLAAFFALFVAFLYGPMSAIFVLSFQGPTGGLTFPMNGVSLRWFTALFNQERTGDFAGGFTRSILLALSCLSLTVVISVLAGLAFRRRFFGSTWCSISRWPV